MDNLKAPVTDKIDLTDYEKTLTVVDKPKAKTSTANPLSDFLSVLPSQWKVGQKFRVVGSSTLLEIYTGSNRRPGIKIYKPVSFESRRIGYAQTKLQPNGKVVKVSGIFELD